MNIQRIERFSKAMAEAELDAIVCRLPENVLLLSGYWPLCGWSFFLFPQDGRPTCILPHSEEKEAKDELWGAECTTFKFATFDSGNPYEAIADALKALSKGKNWKRVAVRRRFRMRFSCMECRGIGHSSGNDSQSSSRSIRTRGAC